MKKIKDKIIYILLSIIFPTSCFAVETSVNLGEDYFGDMSYYPEKKLDIELTIGNIIDWLLSWGMAITILLVVIGGIYYVVSGGNDEKTKKGKTIIVAALIGFILLLSAGLIIRVIINDSEKIYNETPV